MSPSILLRLLSGSLLLAASAVILPAQAADEVKDVRLYALDCGRAKIKDLGMMSDTGEYNGKTAWIADPCFVIRYPKGILLWDTGLGDALADKPDGTDMGAGIMYVDHKLPDQLKEIGLTPADITYLDRKSVV